MHRYSVHILPHVSRQMKNLPGNLRKRMKRLVSKLAENPRPDGHRELSEISVDSEMRLIRIRLDSWRVVYGVDDIDKRVYIFTVRERPPYEYDDLPELVSGI